MRANYSVLIVDDVIENIQIAMSILKEESCDFTFAKSGEDALNLLQKNSFDIILLDIMMPGLDGYEVCRRIQRDPRISDTPVIFLTAKADMDSMAKAFEVGGVDYIKKPFSADELLARVRTHIELYRAKQLLHDNNLSLQHKMKMQKERILTELEDSQKDMIYILTELVESVSSETGRHVHRVAEYSRVLAYHHNILSEEDAETIFFASPLHDIGKMAISQELLQKAGSLSEEEFEIVKTHTTVAHNYLKAGDRKIMKAADIIAYEHHEKWDGTGYPNALKGDEIHLFGRIVALADVFDALTHKLAYKEAWSVEEATSYIVEHSGTQFDPHLVEIFQENIDEFIAISKT